MIEVRGPDNIPKLTWSTPGEIPSANESEAFFATGSTVSEVLDKYCAKFGSSIRGYDGSIKEIEIEENGRKYFFYKSSNPRFGESLVDIHIVKANGKEVCIRQDLEQKVESGDRISIGMLAC